METMDYPAARHDAVGTTVDYTDEMGVKHDALVTAVHGEFGTSCINVLYLSGNPKQNDGHGRQVERASSVMAKSQYAAHGRFYEVR